MILVSKLLKKFFGSRNERVIRKLAKVVVCINELEPTIEKLSAEELRAKTEEFKARLAKGETLDDILIEAFAVVRAASRRTIGLRPFDVQLVGGMILHQGKIAEMCTGEGKTLVATLPAYLNALTGKGVHIVTVNDYLAKRDTEWMGPIYRYLGLSVGVNLPDMSHTEKQEAYACDITYGTNNEFGFDYLRDNMAFSLDGRVQQRGLNYAIIDEVDSILIDEARTPLIISGPTDDNSEIYKSVDRLISKLTKREKEDSPGDYFLDEKQKQAYLTDQGHQHVEELMVEAGLLGASESLYDPSHIALLHHMNAALRAHKLYRMDVDYIVKSGEVVIVDEHTGRTMPGRRWSDSLHQAIEAKEGVEIKNENQTLATITFQNYFRLYGKLAGMTGTADTEAYELQQIYNLEVTVIPTNKPLIRKDYPDKVYLNKKAKFQAVVAEIKECRMRHQPVLVGTASIENSEYLSDLLMREKIEHQVLNAKHHEREAKIIAQAGRPGAVTIATNMAGRGTDIILGGNVESEIEALEQKTDEIMKKLRDEWQGRHNEVVASGGLHVLGSERHESRRIDNQLRGRSGRQGDPGTSRFYVSLEDNLMRIFASDKVSAIMKKLGMKEEDVVEHAWITKAIENAQRKVETFHFDIRKQLLQFDNVANDQRKVIYQQRTDLMIASDISETITAIRKDVVNRLVEQYIPPETLEEQWDVAGLEQVLASDFNVHISIAKQLEENLQLNGEAIQAQIIERMLNDYQAKEHMVGSASMRQFEKSMMLQIIDRYWKEHLATMDHLRHSIHLMGYAQKDPKQEYKRQSFELFTSMLENIKREIIRVLCNIHIATPEEVEAIEASRKQQAMRQAMYYHHDNPEDLEQEETPDETDSASEGKEEAAPVITIRREGRKVGRNEPCPCGSGKKYKQCCGKL